MATYTTHEVNRPDRWIGRVLLRVLVLSYRETFEDFFKQLLRQGLFDLSYCTEKVVLDRIDLMIFLTTYGDFMGMVKCIL